MVLGPAAALVAVAAQSVAYAADPEAGRDGSALDALSVAAVGLASLACAARAGMVRARRGTYAFLAAVLAFLAVDDAVGLHERATQAAAAGLGVSGRGDALFLLPYLPLLALAALALVAAVREAGGGIRLLLSASVALLAASAAFRVGVALVLAAGVSAESWQKSLGGAAIHDAEIAAWLLLAGGVAAGTAAARVRLSGVR